VRVAEESTDGELLGEDVMLGELGAIVEGDGLAQAPVEGLEPGEELIGRRLSGFAGLLGQQEKPRRWTPSGRKAMETRPLMKLAGEPPAFARQPRLYLARGR
jgi:hypothetical protein